MPEELMIRGVIAPAMVSGAVLLVAWLWLRRRRGSGPQGSSVESGTAVAVGWSIALGFAAGDVLLFGWPGEPVEPWQWLPYVALAGAFISVPIAAAGRRARLHDLVDGLWYAGALVLLLRPYPMSSWTSPQTVVWLGGLWLATVIFRILLGELARRLDGGTMALLLVIAGAAGSLLAVCSSNAKLGQLAGVLTAAVGPIMLISPLLMPLSLAEAGTRVFAIMFAGLLVSSYFNDYSGLPKLSFLLVAVAPLCAWVAHVPLVRKLSAWQLIPVRIAGVAIPAAAGVALAWRVYSAAAMEYEY